MRGAQISDSSSCSVWHVKLAAPASASGERKQSAGAYGVAASPSVSAGRKWCPNHFEAIRLTDTGACPVCMVVPEPARTAFPLLDDSVHPVDCKGATRLNAAVSAIRRSSARRQPRGSRVRRSVRPRAAMPRARSPRPAVIPATRAAGSFCSTRLRASAGIRLSHAGSLPRMWRRRPRQPRRRRYLPPRGRCSIVSSRTGTASYTESQRTLSTAARSRRRRLRAAGHCAPPQIQRKLQR
jgi:hypothetical protein